ncbi:MAG: F-type H+-transporting ATPase subunit gamma [Actinomycetota bacterium]|nr:F-type H+-transporting ATPase subunit gamma [Actinomycetota bacterium]
MASGKERALRRRITSVKSTKKITRAMELIAASRIVKAQQRVAAARPYAEQITEVMRNLAGGGAGLDHPLLGERDEVKNVGFVVLSADKGLAGAYNSAVIRAAERAIQEVRAKGQGYSLTLAGRKAEGYFRYRGYKIEDSFTGFSEQPTYEDARRLAEGPMRRYEEGELDRVELVYTRFLSLGSQRVVTVRLLPLERAALEEASPSSSSSGGGSGPKADYEFEPEPSQILEELVPRYVEGRIFAALLDASASEQAARQRAMKAATDNAEELIKTLSITANKVRQAGITTEIMEIVGGAEALRQAKSDGKADYFRDALVSQDVLPDILDKSGARR